MLIRGKDVFCKNIGTVFTVIKQHTMKVDLGVRCNSSHS
jgi:hypothetical protein